MMSRAKKWAVAAIGAFLGTYICSLLEWVGASLGICSDSTFTKEGVIKFLLLWAISTLFSRVFVIWLPDKIRSKKAKRL